MNPRHFLLVCTLSAFILHPSSFCLAQGLLTPPGAPAPTMKTLDQIEARTPISSAPSTINASGSYYLAGNLTVATGTAITINADNVALDLNGFTISSTASPAIGSGVNISGVRKNIQVKNGSIAGTTTVSAGVFTTGGFTTGIFSASVTSRGILIADILISGTGNAGINLADADVPATIVDRCTVSVSGNFGIIARTVRASSATECGGIGIFAILVTDSAGGSLGADVDDHGISASEVINSRGSASVGNGINAATIANSRGSTSTGDGIYASGNVTNSTGFAGGNGDGIVAIGNITNSTGTSNQAGDGVTGANVTNSTGISAGGIGIVASTASFCRGQRFNGTAINAAIAIGCTVSGPGVVTSPSKHLGTP